MSTRLKFNYVSILPSKKTQQLVINTVIKYQLRLGDMFRL